MFPSFPPKRHKNNIPHLQQELALRQAGVHPVVAALYAQQILNNGDNKSIEAKQQELLLHALLAQQNDPKQQQVLLQSLLTQQNLVQQQAILQAILSQAEPKEQQDILQLLASQQTEAGQQQILLQLLAASQQNAIEKKDIGALQKLQLVAQLASKHMIYYLVLKLS